MINLASKEQLRKIALYCDEYDPWRDIGPTLSARTYEDRYENCVNCKHYSKEGRCELNLIDPILSSMAMDTELKS